MKNKNLLTAINYWFLAMALVLFISGCRTKKSTTDFKQTETENVSVTDNSTVAKTETAEENIISRTSSEWSDKSLFEAWMEIKSDEATFEDKAGNKWTFKNPQVNQKSSQTNDIAKTEQTDSESNKVATNEENQQNNINATLSKESKTGFQQKSSSKGKEPVWLYVVGAIFALIIITAGYYTLKRQFGFLLSKKK